MLQWAPWWLTDGSVHVSDFASEVIATDPLAILYAFSLNRRLYIYEENFDIATNKLYFVNPPEYPDNRLPELNVNCQFMWYPVPGSNPKVDRLRLSATWENPSDKGKWPARFLDLKYIRPTHFLSWSRMVVP